MFAQLLNPAAGHAEIVHVVTEEHAVYQYTDDNGKLTGVSAEVVEQLFSLTGDTPRYEVLPWPRAYRQALSQANTMIFSIARTREREPHFQWVGPLLVERLFVWGLRSRFEAPLSRLEDLHPYSIAIPRDNNAHQYLVHEGLQNFLIVQNNSQTANMLFQGRADLMVGTKLGVRTRAKNLQQTYEKLMMVYPLNELDSVLSIAFNRDSDPELVQRFQSALRQMHDDGTVARTKSRWHIEE